MLHDDFGELEPTHMALLDEIVTKHPSLHTKVFELLSRLYDRQANQMRLTEVIIGRQRCIVDRFIQLLAFGFALPVIEKIYRMFREGQIDVSLVRLAAQQIISDAR
ncbi:unnamed protein product [Gongylonema pulchrum]|uniref:ACC_central domain-containing protein n=1 Tax=Gongylonema pulchrum TaxID=637853 RepID=A0A183DIC1_9BILA|nr:unnamed protein product [Gongylonema pulchrum]